MRIICDTREKKNAHILRYFERCGIDYVKKALNVADYQIEGKPHIAIDRKQNLQALSSNLTNKKDSSRFWKEVRRAREQHIKMIVLCEHSPSIKSIPDVAKWHSRYTTVSGRALMEEIYRVHISYGVEFLFCSKKQTGRRIIELLEQGNVER